MQQHLGKSVSEITAEDIIGLVNDWKTAVLDLDHQLYNDAGKEFADIVQIGFGLDGDEQTRRADFAAVRGTYEENSFVTEIEKHITTKTKLGDELIGRVEKLR